jgi:hypothetical protein
LEPLGISISHRELGKEVATLMHTRIMTNRLRVFQKRILCPRVVHFAHNDVFWECRQSFASSMYLSGIPGRGEVMEEVYPTYYSPFHWAVPDSVRGMYPETCVERRWLDLVSWYVECDITKLEDRLPAISAIARQTNEAYLKERYVAGWFKSYLPLALIWGSGFCEGPIDKPNIYVAPTWSWVSVKVTVQLWAG